MTLWTIGHSNRSLDDFLALLAAHQIDVLADVRRFPGSRKHPHFNQEALAQSLTAAGISYEFFPELGGRRKPRPDSPNTAWRNDSFRAYADYMETEEYRTGVERLLSLVNSAATLSGDLRPPLAEARRVAVMCSEAVWWRCHRSLIADYLKSRGVEIEHIMSAKKSEPHPYTSAAKLIDGRLSYAEHETQARLFYDARRIVGMGEVLWDILPDGSRHLGGAPINVAVHAQALGCNASVISAVGDDDLGREAIALLTQRHGLDASAVAVLPDRPTGAVDVRLQDGQPTYEFRSEVAWDYLEATAAAREAATTADAIVFGTLAQRSAVSRRAIHELLAMTRPDCLRVFDVNLRPPFYDDAVLRESLARAGVLKLNDEELPVVLAAAGVVAGADWAAQLFMKTPHLRMVALTRGENGSTLFTGDRPSGHTLPAQRVKVQDTVGAGDAFTAALIAGLLRGSAWEDIHERAVAAAAFVCSQPGATPALPAALVSPSARG